MLNIIGLSGSLRTGSYNSALLRAAKDAAPAGVDVQIASIHDIPLYNADLELSAGIPEPVAQLKDRIAAADGLLLVTPEYSNSIPGVFKNAIDWLARPPADVPRVFRNRPVAVMGATLGRGGTNLAQVAWLPVLRTLGTRPWFGARVSVSEARQVFDETGRLVDERVRSQVTTFMAGFAQYIGGR